MLVLQEICESVFALVTNFSATLEVKTRSSEGRIGIGRYNSIAVKHIEKVRT
jgi:hypothetical protein